MFRTVLEGLHFSFFQTNPDSAETVECEDYCGVTQLNVEGQLPPEAGWLFQKQNNEGLTCC